MLRQSLSIMVASLGLAFALAPALVTPAAAQSMQTYLPRRLTGSDMKILSYEAGKLGPQGPQKESWKNPKTGNSGTVTFLRQYHKSGMECRGFRYTFHTGTAQDGLPYKLNWCERSPGDWAIAN
ncbi:hypothetical protein ACELLULO517_04990 [Acidisoma cellulosilytica]|uniref:Surface antigen domain-containing protein n=1 Tax=Acidisoma cellulosilyticum TaxID=2802395 RepID=A0A963YYW4_9PROT|nr:RT0821/Lpp0805 family surface protein [Acidisoma cellulosilyticum]MCB8879580.1 hypothetical protein [Acidisoma cellulosilyticum]